MRGRERKMILCRVQCSGIVQGLGLGIAASSCCRCSSGASGAVVQSKQTIFTNACDVAQTDKRKTTNRAPCQISQPQTEALAPPCPGGPWPPLLIFVSLFP